MDDWYIKLAKRMIIAITVICLLIIIAIGFFIKLISMIITINK
jgi:hypothetical protein